MAAGRKPDLRDRGGGGGTRGTGRDRRGVWDGSLPGSWERRGERVNPTARRKLRNGGAGVPQDPGSERMERGRAAGRSSGRQLLAAV